MFLTKNRMIFSFLFFICINFILFSYGYASKYTHTTDLALLFDMISNIFRHSVFKHFASITIMRKHCSTIFKINHNTPEGY